MRARGRSCIRHGAATALLAMLAPDIAFAESLQPAAVQPALPTPAAVLRLMRRVADWQLAHLDRFDHMPQARNSVRNPRDWQQATFWVALTELADRARAPVYRAAVLRQGEAVGWQLGDRPFHADDHLIGQAWLWASRNGAGPAAIAPLRARFDQVVARRQTLPLAFVPGPGGRGEPCTVRWCWCDALFMAPPTFLMLARETGETRYARFAHAEYQATRDYLYDDRDHLFFRDSRFFDRRDANGAKLFWSRGNGWVLSGLARIIPALEPDDPMRARYVGLFQQMAARLVRLQKPDGYWAPSLLGDPAAAPPESSGTGFFVHAFAWGIGAGLLDRPTYLPAVARGWSALDRAVQPDGMLGWVQQVSDRPDAVARGDTQFYGTGAFLLAGSAMHDLVRGAPQGGPR